MAEAFVKEGTISFQEYRQPHDVDLEIKGISGKKLKMH
jgi:hypothetical protein